MKSILRATVAMSVLVGPAAAAEKPRYLGRAEDGSGRARVEHGGRLHVLREGDEIPGLGRVKSVTAEAVVVRRALSESEKQARAAAGLVAADAQDVRIPRASRAAGCDGDCKP